ncbi:hypothetical protein H8F21_14180 [Pseudomonas sp. P66]|uniref:Uncharacterized protein n=1 Tax=Pseudomonas arcuscaelestis TaxID=2710591 RepID=A0ABS2BYL6_9PSED|nr:hypothetical protein [Pseudomonas arcuscaelestis]MBM5458712.1 hypothetical protein [Pseudomonas arcuscaelestis]
MATTADVTLSSGITIQLVQPNSIADGDGFYISHNDHDHRLYGGETTALVFGQMQAFYILNGDHREAYAPLIPQGFEACMAYFKANIQLINMRSERPAMPS